jgi:4-amino-4-deoxy-L-arabinose transferase-like glycosyltransferase
MTGGPNGGTTSARLRLVAMSAMAALVWVMIARALGPSDLWDQSQPKTVGYTTDLVAHGRWILPRERGAHPATKPPLYNWLAAPAVRTLGFTSELAHKLPSVVGLALLWLAVVRWGRRLGPSVDPGVGWMAGLMLVANYTCFKLGYLARPDMLLTLWLVLGWMAATDLLASADERLPRRDAWLAAAFWTCTALAALTKGPAALALPIYAVAAAPLVGGRWRAAARLRWRWGVPLAALLPAAWVVAVWRIDPGHVREELWFNEIFGRVTGLGPEGSREGPAALLRNALEIPFYFLVRFLPWSPLAIAALVVLWGRSAPGGRRRWRDLGIAGRRLEGAAVFVVVILGLYTLSAGKRADYVAAAYGPAALLAAWWLGTVRRGRGWWFAPAAAVLLVVATVNNERAATAPTPDFGDAILAFARDARATIDAEPHPVHFWRTGSLHLQALLGASETDDPEAILPVIDRGETIWVVAGGYRTGPWSFEEWVGRRRWGVGMTPVVQSRTLPELHGWLIRATLFRVEPSGPEPPYSSGRGGGSDK